MSRLLNTATIFTAMLGTCLVALPASAQQNQQDQQRQRRQQMQRQQQQRQQQRRQQQRQQNQRQQNQQQQNQQRRQQQDQGRQLALQPQGWVTVGVDYDQDNRFDAVETIYYYDLVQAAERSAQRRGQQGRQQQMARGQQQQQQQQQRQQMRRISGQLTELTTVRLTDGQRHRLAKLQTQQGQTVPVDLGRVEQVNQLNLQQGDQVTIVGAMARINDRPVVSARRIQTDQQQITVNRDQDRGLKRVRGQIANLRTTRFRGRDQQFQVAEVNLRGGRTETVILGPQNRVQQLDLQRGDQVRLLVRPGRLNNEMALIAEQVRANERTMRVQEPQGRRFSARQQQQQQRQQQ